MCNGSGHCMATGCMGDCPSSPGGGSYNYSRECGCDSYCGVIGDCCSDFCEACATSGTIGGSCDPTCEAECVPGAADPDFFNLWDSDDNDVPPGTFGTWVGSDGCGGTCPCPDGSTAYRTAFCPYERYSNAVICIETVASCDAHCGDNRIINQGTIENPDFCTCGLDYIENGLILEALA